MRVRRIHIIKLCLLYFILKALLAAFTHMPDTSECVANIDYN